MPYDTQSLALLGGVVTLGMGIVKLIEKSIGHIITLSRAGRPILGTQEHYWLKAVHDSLEKPSSSVKQLVESSERSEELHKEALHHTQLMTQALTTICSTLDRVERSLEKFEGKIDAVRDTTAARHAGRIAVQVGANPAAVAGARKE